MSRALLHVVRRAALSVAGLLCAALGLRVMIAAIAEARAVPPVLAEQAEAVPPLLELAEELATAPVESPVEPVKARLPDAISLRVMLSVTAGPARSEVYVNGARLGLSPYFGDFTCKQGEPLTIEVVPEHAALITREVACMGRNLFIRD